MRSRAPWEDKGDLDKAMAMHGKPRLVLNLDCPPQDSLIDNGAKEEEQPRKEWPPPSARQLQYEQMQKQAYVAALTASKGLWQARDAVPFKSTLSVTTSKLHQARTDRQEWALLGFLARKAPMLTATAHVDLEYEFDVKEVLRWLDGVQKLEVVFADRTGTFSFTVPETLVQLTSLTYLSLINHAGLDPWELTELSSLTALQSFKYQGPMDDPIPPGAFRGLGHLTSLDLEVCGSNNFEEAFQLTAAHLSACTGLRRLVLPNDMEDLCNWKQVQLRLSLEEAPNTLQQLEEIDFALQRACSDPAFWRVLPLLPSLRRLKAGIAYGALSAVLRECLPACQHLAHLDLYMYSEPSLVQLPSSLTSLTLTWSSALQTVPLTASICSLSLEGCHELLDWPPQVSGFTQLTPLSLESCHLAEVPGCVASLPALEVLEMADNNFQDLPQLGCINTLRRLGLYGSALPWVPCTLEGASRLSYLNLAGQLDLVVEEDGLAVLCSLPVLKFLAVSECEGIELEDLVEVGEEEGEEGVGDEEEEEYYGYVGWSRLRGSLPGVQIADLEAHGQWVFTRDALEEIERFGV
ncbi:hypothetical protein N2152v2_008228 [Parachlorella kessleri]